MSPASGDAPKTPERSSSSSTLFGAFRSLAGGRIRNPPTPASPVRVRRATSLGTPSQASAQAPSISPPAPGESSRAADHVNDNRPSLPRTVVGGPAELDELLPQLGAAQPFSNRVVAIEKLCVILKEYPIRNVLALWYSAQDLLDSDRPLEAREAGYNLLKSCACLPHLGPVERATFFEAAAARDDTQLFDTRLEIILDLTNGGRNIEALETYIAPFLLKSLGLCYTARKLQSKKRSDQVFQEEENLAQLFQYIIDIIRFSSRAFDEQNLELLLSQVMAICQETTRPMDIEYSVKLFDALITYAQVPKRSLKLCLEVFCTVHRQITGQQQPTWNMLTNLFKSHIGQAAVASLLNTLFHGAIRKSRQSNIFRGVIHVLQMLLLEDERGGLPKVPISLLFPALKVSIELERQSQENTIFRFLAAILSEEQTRLLLLHEGDWTNLLDIIRICTERIEQRETANVLACTVGDGPVDMSTGASITSAERDSNTTPDPGSVRNKTQIDDDRKALDDLSRILSSLDSMQGEMDFVQKTAVMELFMSLPGHLCNSVAESVVNFCVEERYLYPSHSNWLDCWRTLVGVVKNYDRPQGLRLSIIDALKTAYHTIAGLCPPETVHECAFLLIDRIIEEKDIHSLEELAGFALEVAGGQDDETFSEITSILHERLNQAKEHPSDNPPGLSLTAPSTAAGQPAQHIGSASSVVASTLVRLFLRSVRFSVSRPRSLLHVLLDIAGSSTYETDARITVLKLLFRVRADANNAIFVNTSSEGEYIASVLYRTAETIAPSDGPDEPAHHETVKNDEQHSWRDFRKSSGSSPHTSLSRHTSRHGQGAGRVSKPPPPLWMYPGPKGLPEEPSPFPSQSLFSYIDPDDEPFGENQYELKIVLWIELVISILQKPYDWEVYSYVLVHLAPQLSNHSLFRNAVRQIRMLRSVVCEQIRSSTFHEPPLHTLLKKGDVALCLIHVLTVLVSYHAHYEKSEEDELVRAFLHGMGAWDRTPKLCIHALTVCCHEMPLSVSKSLDNIIQKMSQIITQPHIAIHILEFLTSLARMPELYKNFREDEFKTVFGVSFRYLQYVRDQRERASSTTSPPAPRQLRHSGPSRDFSAWPDQGFKSKTKSVADDLPQYVYALAFHVITFWFMALKMPERKKYILWIKKNLIYTDRTGKEVAEEQSEVILDMMHMVAYSDRDETAPDPSFPGAGDGEVHKKTWIVGHSLMTIETAGKTGATQILSRRACGTRYFSMHPLLTQPPRHQVPITTGLAAETWDSSTTISILPDDIFQSLYSPFNFPSVLDDFSDYPIPLPEDDMTRRAIAAFDRNPPIDTHKVGVIYLAEGQTHERDILQNIIGSPAYCSFVSDLGTLVRLKDAKFNTGGLDTRNDQDGEFTMCWRDRCIELVFHVTTMMPTSSEDADLTYANKKRHIGNDFVNVIFNDSGLPYDFNTFPSQFNYVHIVVTPESRASFAERRHWKNFAKDPEGRSRAYKVQVVTQQGFPDISPAAETKIVSGRSLAAYIRLISINASVFSQVWCTKDGAESASSWRNRLREIKRLRERYANSVVGDPIANSVVGTAGSSLTGGIAGGATPGTGPISPLGLSSPQSRENMNVGVAGFKRTSMATFVSEGTTRSSVSGANGGGTGDGE